MTLTGKSAGTSVITVTYKDTSEYKWVGDGYAGTVTLTVQDKTENKYFIGISYPATTISVGGKTKDPTVTLYHHVYTNGTLTSTVNDGTLSSGLSFSSSDTSVGTISSTGVVTGVKEGKTNASVTYSNTSGKTWEDGGATAEQEITVQNAVTYSLVVTPSTMSLDMLNNKTGNATATYYVITNGVSDAGTDVTASATWTSDKTTVATVSSGTVTAKSAGTATVTATYSGLSDDCDVTVTDVTEDKYYILITLSPSSVTEGGTSTASAKLYYNRYVNGVLSESGKGGTAIASDKLTVSSGTTSVATVSGTTITAVGAGTSTITAEYNTPGDYVWDTGGISDSATLTVNPGTTYKYYITANIDRSSIDINGTASVTVKSYYNVYSGTTKTKSAQGETVLSTTEVTVSSSNPGVASVSGFTVTGVSDGSVTLTATATSSYQSGKTWEDGGTTATVGCTVNPSYYIKVVNVPTEKNISATTSGDFTITSSNVEIWKVGGSKVGNASNFTVSSSNTSVATVSSKTVHPFAKGTTTITVVCLDSYSWKSGGNYASFTLTVNYWEIKPE